MSQDDGKDGSDEFGEDGEVSNHLPFEKKETNFMLNKIL